MKRFAAAVCCGILLPGLAFADDAPKKGATKKKEEPKQELKTLEERASYAIGLNIGQNMLKSNAKLNMEMLIQGLRDGLGKSDPLLSEEELQATMQEFQKAMEAQATEKGKANIEAGAAFLAANGKKEGITTTKTGLQYKVIKSGKGRSPKASDVVRAHYSGKLLDGTEFDSSYKRGEPLEIPVNRVIPGWTEALQLMKPGDKWQLYIPSALAYGPRGTEGLIGPNATLIFDIELVEVLAAEEVK